MTGTEPGERVRPGGGERSARLAEPPSARYAADRGGKGAQPGAPGDTGDAPVRSALPGPLIRALVVSALGAAALAAVGGILASTAGLLFTSGVAGAGIGLVLAGAAVPRDDARAATRRTITWLAIGLALATVVGADVATWLLARSEGGTLDLLDYLWTTFGPYIPAEAAIGALAAAWGASAGPVRT